MKIVLIHTRTSCSISIIGVSQKSHMKRVGMSENELCPLDFAPDPDLGPLLSQEQTHAMFGHDEEIRGRVAARWKFALVFNHNHN